MDLNGIKIVICMGSACYLRGNNKHLLALKQYLKEEGLFSVQVSGDLCCDICQGGPNIFINDKKVEGPLPESLFKELNKLRG